MSPEDVTPPPPEGVWLEYADGSRYTELPVIFLGIDVDETAVFEIVAPRDDAPTAAGMRRLPAKTSISIPALQPKEHHGPHPTDPDRDDRGPERGGADD